MSRYNINLYSFVPPFSCLLDRKGFSFLFFKGFFLGGVVFVLVFLLICWHYRKKTEEEKWKKFIWIWWTMLLRNLSDNLWQGTVERSNLPALHAIQCFFLTLERLDVTSLSWNWNFTRDTISSGFSEGPPGGLWGVVISCGRSELEKIIVAETTELLQDKLRWAFSYEQPKAGRKASQGWQLQATESMLVGIQVLLF